MAKAIAISLESPFGLALKSLHNFFNAVVYFMYGTAERTRYTYSFALGLAALGALLNMADTSSVMACGHDSLANTL